MGMRRCLDAKINPICLADPDMKTDTGGVGFLIGNGVSRVGFDLNRLTGKGITVGCNYIYRDYEPDYIVAIDTKPVQDILELIGQGVKRKWKFLTRNYLDRGFWFLCADGEKIVRFASVNHRLNLNSGIIGAYFLACTMRVEKLYLLGIDMFREFPDGRDNDVYFGVCKTGQRIGEAWRLLASDHPDTEFIRVGPIPEWDREYFETELTGYTLMESFEDMLSGI